MGDSKGFKKSPFELVAQKIYIECVSSAWWGCRKPQKYAAVRCTLLLSGNYALLPAHADHFSTSQVFRRPFDGWLNTQGQISFDHGQGLCGTAASYYRIAR